MKHKNCIGLVCLLLFTSTGIFVFEARAQALKIDFSPDSSADASDVKSPARIDKEATNLDAVSNDRKISRGNPVTTLDPWIVSVVRSKTHFENPHWCGGVLVSQSAVLTAAHCVNRYVEYNPERKFKPLSAGFLSVVSGTANLRVGGHRHRVTTIAAYPDYDLEGDTHQGDLAILFLDEKLKIAPIELANDAIEAEIVTNNTAGWISGWGHTETKDSPVNDLRSGPITFLDRETCRSRLGPRIDETVICAGANAESAGSCKGDSGGPLSASFEQNPYLIALVSTGQGQCGGDDSYGIYMRIAHFREWILRCSQTSVCEEGTQGE